MPIPAFHRPAIGRVAVHEYLEVVEIVARREPSHNVEDISALGVGGFGISGGEADRPAPLGTVEVWNWLEGTGVHVV